MYVVSLVTGPTDSEPDVPRLPLQPPDAVQLLARFDDQVSVTLLPLATDVLEAFSVTLAAPDPLCGLFVPELLPLQPASSSTVDARTSGADLPISKIRIRGRLEREFTYFFGI